MVVSVKGAFNTLDSYSTVHVYMYNHAQDNLAPSVLHFSAFINARRMREGYCSQFVCVSVCLSVCLLPIKCQCTTCVRQIELTSIVFTQLPRFPTGRFRSFRSYSFFFTLHSQGGHFQSLKLPRCKFN